MTSNYDPSTPLKADASDEQMMDRLVYRTHQAMDEHPNEPVGALRLLVVGSIVREFAAAAVSDAVGRERATPKADIRELVERAKFNWCAVSHSHKMGADQLTAIDELARLASEERARRIPSRETLVQIIEDHAPNMIKSHGQRGACERCNALADAIFPLFQEPTPH